MASLRFSSYFGLLVGLSSWGATAGCAVKSGDLVEASPSPTIAEEEFAPKKQVDAATISTTGATIDLCANKPTASAGRRDQVCYRWQCDGRDAKTPAKWNGSATTCSAGDLDADAGDRALRLVNLHRYLAEVAPVTAVPSWSSSAQKCALVAHANAKLSHNPPRDWQCWSNAAAETSEVSLIANRSAPPAVAAYMEDPGNEETMVHRRWLLSEDLTRIGFGSTDKYSCIVVDGRKLDDSKHDNDNNNETTKRGWVAWPPAGPVPFEVFASERLDEVGWTVQSASSDLDRATGVTVKTASGVSRPMRMTRLKPLQGSRSAIRFVPDGWKTEAGQTYSVTVNGPSVKIDFIVEPVSCGS